MEYSTIKPEDFESPKAAERITLEYGKPLPSHFGGEVQTVFAHPASPSHEPPILFEGGFRVDNLAYIARLAECGREAYTFRHAGRQSDTDVLVFTDEGLQLIDIKTATPRLREPESPDMMVSRHRIKIAATKLACMEEQNIGVTDAIFQCANGVDGMLAGLVSKNIRNIILVNPGGIVKQDASRSEGLKNAFSFLALKVTTRLKPHESFKKYSANTIDESNSKSHKASATITDGASVGVSYHADLLTKIRGREDGPNVSIAIDLNDKLMNWRKLISNLRPDDADFLLITNRLHGIGYSKNTMAWIVDLFPRMNALRKERKNNSEFITPPLRERLVFSPDVTPELIEEVILLADHVEARDRAEKRKYGQFPLVFSRHNVVL